MRMLPSLHFQYLRAVRPLCNQVTRFLGFHSPAAFSILVRFVPSATNAARWIGHAENPEPFSILVRFVPSATRSRGFWASIALQLSVSSCGSSPLQLLRAPGDDGHAGSFQYPRADRPLCNSPRNQPPRNDMHTFQYPRADRPLCNDAGKRRYRPGWYFQYPQADRPLCNAAQNAFVCVRRFFFQYPRADRPLCNVL